MSVLRRPGRRRRPPLPPDLAAALLESLADGVIACDASGTLVVFNRAAREIHGLPAEGVPPERWGEHCDICERGARRPARTEELPLHRALAGEQVRDVELEVRPRRGRPRIVRVSGAPVLAAGGRLAGAVIVMRDVTDRVRMEGAFRLRSAVTASMAEGVAVIRASDGVIVYVNEAWERMFRYGPGELVGRHISVVNAATGTTPEETAERIFDALEREGSWTGEIENVRSDGCRIWTAANVSTMEHPSHGTVWISVQRDVTARKLAERALRDAEERFRAVFEEGPLGIVMLTPELRVADANPAFCHMLRMPHSEVAGSALEALTHPDDVERDAELARRLFAGEIPRYRLEKRFRTRGGEVVWASLTATVVRGADGRPLYGLGFAEPIPERRDVTSAPHAAP